ncbi:MAG: PEP-utilizing enzyme [Candidatus Micrarchaeota archaeon]
MDAKAAGILRKKLEKSPEKFADYYIALTRPPKRLKTQLMEAEILELANEAKKKGVTARDVILGRYSHQLQKIADKYEWISFDLCINVGWKPGHYADLVLERQMAEIDAELEFIGNYEKRVADEFERICKELKLADEEKSLFDFIRMLGYYKWAREHEFTEAFYNLAPIQKELGGRCGLDPVESAYILPHEYQNALKYPEKYQQIANERIKMSVLLVNREGYEFLTGNAAAEYMKGMEFLEEKIEKDVSELKGMPACSGIAKGKAKIINTAADMHKMGKGDILISAATTPDLVPAMKKAAAIITNEGGITCHAAIVSRELKIPCIVGVKNANKILKDGDEIEVDANRGVIRRL